MRILIRDPAVLRFPSFRATRVKVGQDTLQAEKEDQEMAEACKRLIKNCIICWNYLYLSQKLAEIDDPAKREELPRVMAHGSATAWWVSECAACDRVIQYTSMIVGPASIACGHVPTCLNPCRR